MEEQRLSERIYELVWDKLDLAKVYVPESEFVKSEFQEGYPCYSAYCRMLEAYCRICKRSGEEDDEDIEIIIDELFEIGRHVSLIMFEYGVKFGKYSNP